MKYKVKKVGDFENNIEIDIDFEDLESKKDEAINNISNSLKVKGKEWSRFVVKESTKGTAIIIPKPDALPANPGLTETIPAAALGTVKPFPRPTKNIGTKKLNAPNWKLR